MHKVLTLPMSVYLTLKKNISNQAFIVTVGETAEALTTSVRTLLVNVDSVFQ
jgi:hypothetical protein